LTDGEISERNEFLQALIEASKEQISIIIVGVGEASFESMEELLQTENDLPLEVNGKRAKRNIVQFVRYEGLSLRYRLLCSKIVIYFDVIRQRDFGEELAANVLQQVCLTRFNLLYH
jgi:pheromone shutdown protein TraB